MATKDTSLCQPPSPEMRIENMLEEGRSGIRGTYSNALSIGRDGRLVARQGSVPASLDYQPWDGLRFCGSQGDIGFRLAGITTTRQKGWENNVDSGAPAAARLFRVLPEPGGPGEEMKGEQ